jgi:hypothetical protein
VQLYQPSVLHKLAALDARLLVISFAPLLRMEAWVPFFQANFIEPFYKERGLKMPTDPFERTHFLADPVPSSQPTDSALSVYHTYGLGRNSLLKVYGPDILRQYAQWAIEGKPIKKPTEDPLQRGGNFVVGRDSRLTLSHVGRDQSDRPKISRILASLS